MVTTQNLGDFANHIFQYIFIRLHAEKNSLDWYFYNHFIGNPKQTNAYNDIFNLFDLPKGNMENYDRYTKNLKDVIVPDGYHNIEGKDNIVYDGYFQSEKYFINHMDKINEWLRPKEEFITQSKPYICNILKVNNCSIDDICVIHYRGTTYKRLGWDMNPLWYEKAIEKMSSIRNIKKFIIMTDDVPYCKQLWGDQYEILNNNRLIDFTTLYQFTNFIISPSSFSFWPAWLSGKNVIAPKFWFGSQSNEWQPSKDIKVTSRDWIYL
jgi:hypothetical protein